MHRLADVAALIDPSNAASRLATLRTWFARGVLQWNLDPEGGVYADQAPAKAGSAGKLSEFQVVKIAIAVRLSDLGLSPSEAVEAAATFSHFGISGRVPAGLFAIGRTYLAVWRSEGGQILRRVVNASPSDTLDRLTFFLNRSDEPAPRAVVWIDCEAVLDDLAPLIGTTKRPARA